jgi:hypothetical protein
LVGAADASLADKLPLHYTNKALGDESLRHQGATVVFDFGEWSSAVASRKKDDSTISFVAIDPGGDGLEFVVGERVSLRKSILSQRITGRCYRKTRK